MSKSQVSRMSEELYDMVADFKIRPLDSGGYAYLSCDAVAIKVREGGRVVKCSVPVGHWGQRRRVSRNARQACRHRGIQCLVEGLSQDLKACGDLPASSGSRSPAMPTKACSTPFPKCCLTRRGSGAAPISQRTSTRRFRNRSGRWFRRCSRQFSNNPMLHQPGPKLARLSICRGRNSRRFRLIRKNYSARCWRLPQSRNRCGQKCG